MVLACVGCHQHRGYPLSCGHRSCPKCQNHETSRWLARQQAKLLPVEYFLVTFTLPRELRLLAWRHQRQFYALLLTLAAKTLKDFGVNPKQLGADIGLTAILHTHSRRLDYHPHVHVIVPGGGVNRHRKQWRKLRSKYLFNQKALARVFRARMLAAIQAEGLSLPGKLPRQWVVDCKIVDRLAITIYPCSLGDRLVTVHSVSAFRKALTGIKLSCPFVKTHDVQFNSMNP